MLGFTIYLFRKRIPCPNKVSTWITGKCSVLIPGVDRIYGGRFATGSGSNLRWQIRYGEGNERGRPGCGGEMTSRPSPGQARRADRKSWPLTSRCLEKPFEGGDGLNADGSGGGDVKGVKVEQKEACFGELFAGLQKSAGFAFKCGGIGGIGAYLDEDDAAIGIDGMKVDLISVGGAEIVHLESTSLKFEEDCGFEGVAGVIAPGAFVEGDQAGVDGIGFTGIDHALALRGGEHRSGADKESVLEVGKKGVEGVLGHGQAL